MVAAFALILFVSEKQKPKQEEVVDRFAKELGTKKSSKEKKAALAKVHGQEAKTSAPVLK